MSIPVGGPGPSSEPSGVRADLVDRLVAHEARVLELELELERMHAASAASNADDEHDPEGATIAFERQQLVSVLVTTRSTRDELHLALSRLGSGDYGVCRSCGHQIAPARLAARPQAATCIECARSAP